MKVFASTRALSMQIPKSIKILQLFDKNTKRTQVDLLLAYWEDLINKQYIVKNNLK